MEPLVEQAFFDSEHHLFRQMARRFIQDTLAPHVDRWEEEKSFPREVYKQVGEAGLLGIGFPEEYGGAGGDLFHSLILAEELIRSGSPGLASSLGSLSIAMPPVIFAGTDEQKARFLPPVFAGEKISALAVTEPDAGSDVASIRTRAVRDGEGYRLTGQKTFITSGCRADLLTVLARTGGEGAGGVSLFILETDSPGYAVSRNLPKMGWHASDTAELSFEEVWVPEANRIGPEGGGFGILMQNFANERLLLAVGAVAIAQMAFEAACAYAEQRQAFGRPIGRFQVTRHKLADMATRIEVCRTFNYTLASQVMAGTAEVAHVAMAKNASTDMAMAVVDEAVQIHGGYGYMREFLVERLYRDIRLYPIGGGTREIMNELISRAL